MKNIIKFPVQQQQPEPQEPIELPEIDLDELTDVDYVEMYSENNDDAYHDRCRKCGKVFNYEFDEQIWSINQQAGYGSRIDGETLTIKICDCCLISWLNLDDRK